MDKSNLKTIITESWTKETSYDPKNWTPENPAWGQCAITALVVQDYLGGEILYCRHNHHYWNRLQNQEEIDFTRIQFLAGTTICLDEIKPRDYLLNSEAAIKATTPQRYELLKRSVDKKIES